MRDEKMREERVQNIIDHSLRIMCVDRLTFSFLSATRSDQRSLCNLILFLVRDSLFLLQSLLEIVVWSPCSFTPKSHFDSSLHDCCSMFSPFFFLSDDLTFLSVSRTQGWTLCAIDCQDKNEGWSQLCHNSSSSCLSFFMSLTQSVGDEALNRLKTEGDDVTEKRPLEKWHTLSVELRTDKMSCVHFEAKKSPLSSRVGGHDCITSSTTRWSLFHFGLRLSRHKKFFFS